MKYLTFFTTDACADRCLSTAPPAVTKSTYMAQLLHDIGQPVEIVSPAWSKCGAWKHWPASDTALGDRVTLHQLATFGAPWRWLTPVQWVYSLGQLFFYLLRSTRAGEPVLVYHSYYFSLPVLLAKRIKKFKLILEVEEIYQDIIRLPRLFRHLEWRIIRSADAYVFSTAAIGEVSNRKSAPAMVVNGAYRCGEHPPAPPFADGKIHCLYSGTFDKVKAGAYLAVDAAAFLPAGYCVHISGQGNDAQIRDLQEEIRRTRQKTPCRIVYEGFLDQEAYQTLLQKCHIGLNTQTPDQRFSDTCFPSKILVYMANGLQVVSAANKAITRSDVGGRLTYYHAQTAESVARAILSVPPDAGKENTLFVQSLHRKACEEMKTLLARL